MAGSFTSRRCVQDDSAARQFGELSRRAGTGPRGALDVPFLAFSLSVHRFYSFPQGAAGAVPPPVPNVSPGVRRTRSRLPYPVSAESLPRIFARFTHRHPRPTRPSCIKALAAAEICRTFFKKTKNFPPSSRAQCSIRESPCSSTAHTLPIHSPPHGRLSRARYGRTLQEFMKTDPRHFPRCIIKVVSAIPHTKNTKPIPTSIIQPLPIPASKK